MTTAETQTFKWVARGYTEDVNECEHCGRIDLKGTVRMEAVDAEGELDDGERYMGVVCAAKMTGRKASEIRAEAASADRERDAAIRETYRAWSDVHSSWTVATTTATVGEISRTVKPTDWMAYHRTDEFKAAEAAWLVANPMPARPW